MLDELVDQQRVLSEMEMDVARQQIGTDEALVADRIPLGILHLIGGLEPAVLPDDAAPVEFVTTVELPLGGQDALLEREQLAVAEAMDLSVHLDVDGNHAGHLVGFPALGAKRAPQVHEPAAFGIDWHPAAVGPLDRLGHGPIVFERLDKNLRESAAEVETGSLGGQMLVLERAEGHDIGPVLLKQLEILRVIAVE